MLVPSAGVAILEGDAGDHSPATVPPDPGLWSANRINGKELIMKKATENGTCQCCGATHAYSGNGIAKHGYTTRYGFFEGICPGSDNAPLELADDLNRTHVQRLREFADKKDAEALVDPKALPVQKRTRNYPDPTIVETVFLDREQYEAGDVYRDWDRGVVMFKRGLQSIAAQARSDADVLDGLRETVHGQPLQARETEAPLRREYVKGYRAAFARCEELKAAGKRDVRQRRDGYSQGYRVTYRD